MPTVLRGSEFGSINGTLPLSIHGPNSGSSQQQKWKDVFPAVQCNQPSDLWSTGYLAKKYEKIIFYSQAIPSPKMFPLNSKTHRLNLCKPVCLIRLYMIKYTTYVIYIAL